MKITFETLAHDLFATLVHPYEDMEDILLGVSTTQTRCTILIKLMMENQKTIQSMQRLQ